MTIDWRPAGDSAWVATAAAQPPPGEASGGPAGSGWTLTGSMAMHGLAGAVSAAGLPGVRDIVPSCTAVTVHVHPLRAGDETIQRLRHLTPAAMRGAGRVVEVPVVYDGPDLDEVAALTGLDVPEVVARHARGDASVLMLGFAPGFPYLAPVDAVLTLPRRATPRVRVPAGAVGIAAGLTCIYPGGTGGGWHLIGRTGLTLFDPVAVPPATLRPGDRIRWMPVDRLEPASATPAGAGAAFDGVTAARSTGGLTVLRPGQLTSVQDAGRWGFQAMGVPVSGACDAGASRRANAAVGNAADAAVIEISAVGPDLRFEQPVTLAWAGSSMDVEVDGRAVPPETAVAVPAGGVLRCGAVRGGLRTYLAVAGGIDVPLVLGSRSACLGAGFGGGAGRALAAGDHLPVGRPAGDPASPRVTGRGGVGPGEPRRTALRVLPGPDAASVPGRLIDALLERPLTVSRHVNRAGCRLTGDLPETGAPAGDRPPTGTVPGAVQVTPHGDLLLLLADRQPTGGYPQVLCVIAADLDDAAQLCPGDPVTFSLCSQQDAMRALADREARLSRGC
ncbi:MAG: carboxyltransferase domain-containing protein [Vicinamibacterales bacterium]